nr:kinesin-like protein kif22 [Quercus suber]
MSVRVVARLRPLLKTEHQRDVIVETASASGAPSDEKTIIRMPNPKNEFEAYSFQFNSVYDQDATQSELFDQEIAPTVKQLFKGCDVTIFAYGVTGTGKTHTMRGGKSLVDRGVIPRLLSSVYRRARKIEKDTAGETRVEVSMSYYEIFCDRVYDLFEPLEKRTPAGLPIRDTGNGKCQVVGLTERPCTSLKEFETLYDQANVNRSTSATKLNAHSSRSHAILCVKVTQRTGDEIQVSQASAIDLAGSEDNRRTDNNKERLVESASINKSLFVLAQCVEAISKKQARIPYRESKMTRILSLGASTGITIMILNLAPMRSYHLDTLSSLNFANRTKKIEVNEVENQPYLREPPGKSKSDGSGTNSLSAPPIHRQPLASKIFSQNSHLRDAGITASKPTKQFAVYSDKTKPAPKTLANSSQARSSTAPLRSPKRACSEALPGLGRPSKVFRTNDFVKVVKHADPGMTKDAIEAMIERKVNEALAERADQTTVSSGEPISDEVQKRLDALEKRVEGKETERAEGLQYLLMAKQHQVRGEDISALKMYQLALPHFPGNERLVRKMAALQDKITARKTAKRSPPPRNTGTNTAAISEEQPEDRPVPRRKPQSHADAEDESYHDLAPTASVSEDDEPYRPRTKIRRPQTSRPTAPSNANEPMSSEDELSSALTSHTPRTKLLLQIINTKDVSRIKLLKGVGAKKAEAIVNCLCDLEDDDDRGATQVTTLAQLGKLKGVGVKTVENMRSGVVVSSG